MPKQRHIHAIIAEVTIAIPYDPANIEEAAKIQAQIREQARKLTGFTGLTTRLGKVPAPS